MRNKANFLEDISKVVKSEVLEEVDFVEDAAHTLNNDLDNVGEFTVLDTFTSTGKNESFYFSKQNRPASDNPNSEVEDWFYEGRMK